MELSAGQGSTPKPLCEPRHRHSMCPEMPRLRYLEVLHSPWKNCLGDDRWECQSTILSGPARRRGAGDGHAAEGPGPGMVGRSNGVIELREGLVGQGSGTGWATTAQCGGNPWHPSCTIVHQRCVRPLDSLNFPINTATSLFRAPSKEPHHQTIPANVTRP